VPLSVGDVSGWSRVRARRDVKRWQRQSTAMRREGAKAPFVLAKVDFTVNVASVSGLPLLKKRWPPMYTHLQLQCVCHQLSGILF
jgi:hypothetical protein